MNRLLVTSFVYMILGLASGLFYREYSKLTGTVGEQSQLSTLHTHLLVLGMLVFLVLLAVGLIALFVALRAAVADAQERSLRAGATLEVAPG